MRIIDKETWPRKAHYDFFAPMSHPFYSLTFPVDVTALRVHTKTAALPFYPALVFLVTKAMENVDAFLYRDRNGVIVRHDRLVPSFTDLKPGSELFHIVTLDAGEDLADFCRRAKVQSETQTEFITAGPWDQDQEIYFSCVPWFPITALTNERNVDPSDSIPRVTWGRWEEREGRTWLNLSLELNHRLLDGYHVGQFYQALNDRLAALPEAAPMTARELEARWRDHVPGLMGAGASYAVLVPLVCQEGKEPALLFEVRASTLRRQPGEVCFPGGKMEPGETPVQCALREAWEELGIPASAVEVVGQLDFLCHQSGFLMYPVLGRVAGRGPEGERLNAAEVAETFLVPLSFFETHPPEVWSYPLKPELPADFPYERVGIPRDYPWRGGRADVPIYLYGGHTIWGLTGRIVRHLFGH